MKQKRNIMMRPTEMDAYYRSFKGQVIYMTEEEKQGLEKHEITGNYHGGLVVDKKPYYFASLEEVEYEKEPKPLKLNHIRKAIKEVNRVRHDNSAIWCQNDKRRKHKLIIETKKKREKKFFGLKTRLVYETKQYCKNCHFNRLSTKIKYPWKWVWII